MKIQILKFIQKYFPTNIGPMAYFMVFLQFFYMYQIHSAPNMGGFKFTLVGIGFIILSLFQTLLFFQIISTAFSFNKIALVISNMMFLGIFGLGTAYHFAAKEPFDAAIIIDNFSSIFNVESPGVMLSLLNLDALYYTAGFMGIWLFFEIWKKWISGYPQQKPYWPKIGSTLLLYVLIVAAPITAHDPYTHFFKTIYRYVFKPPVTIVYEAGTFPLIQNGESFNHIFPQSPSKPHVFIILVESLKESVILKKTDTHREITPFMNDLIQKSIYIPHFYGNSIQTSKGHFATLFSMIPSLTGKVFTKYPDIQAESIGTYLKKVGYTSHFVQAYHVETFDNTIPFLSQRGFEHALTITPYLKK
ncbi:MAG: sulfatase-like hydrolase/transferase, partial [Candidatus Margulisbacteria bacterium]|nr:sulfatase-like hydrolase/transferase [Candidatus Margulisiibacteriota bacterium]